MSGSISIGSTAEWDALLSGTNVVVADFYADWCGPCKMMAPTFESLAKQHSRPKKVAFAKVNVDSQSGIARANGVSAMPTFKIFVGGACTDTIKGANPSALNQAVANAVKVADSGTPGDVFKTPGRTLGGRGGAGLGLSFSSLMNALFIILGLYFVSLLSFDPYMAAMKSRFNIYRPKESSTPSPSDNKKPNPSRPTQKPTFTTLADLGKDS